MDASSKIVGRLANQIAHVLMGKHKPIYHRAADSGDYVDVTNARNLVFSGQKPQDKVYYSHTGYPGGLRTTPVSRLYDTNPTDILRRAVYGMLPKNRTRRVRMARLYIFPTEKHPYESNIFKRYVTQPIDPIFPLRNKEDSPTA